MGKQVSREVFVDAWERHAARNEAGLTTDPIRDIANELGVKESTVRQRSSGLRNPKNGEAAVALTKLKNRATGPRGSRVADATATIATSLADIQARAKAAVEAEKAAANAPVETSETSETPTEGESVPVETAEVEGEQELVGAEA